MTVSTSSMMSGEAIPEAQTPENTVAPFEAPPVPKKAVGFTKEMREAKIAAGWIPPEKRVKEEIKLAYVPQEHNEAERLLENLVAKMVGLENNAAYQSMWLNFFQQGGVYTGPNYTDELREACNFLNARHIQNRSE